MLAIISMALGEIALKPDGEPNYHVAAQIAVLRCEGMDHLPNVFATLIDKELAERISKDDRVVLARIRLIHRALTAEGGRGLSGHIEWLRQHPAILADLADMAKQLVAEELVDAEMPFPVSS